MDIQKTSISGLLVVTPQVFADERGFFMETFSLERYREVGIGEVFVQDNVSLSKKGVLRGLHYQTPPFAQGKLVQVLKGSVLDVAVDIRFGSPTFGEYVAVELTGENHKQFWIPAGFAHAFVSLEDETIFSYKCTAQYSKEHERGVRYDDPDLGIAWPVSDLLVSEKDQKLPSLKDIPQEFHFSSTL